MTCSDFIIQCEYNEGWIYTQNYRLAAVWLHTRRLPEKPDEREVEEAMYDFFMETWQ